MKKLVSLFIIFSSICAYAQEGFVPAEQESLYSTIKQGGPIMIFIILLAVVGLTIIIERIIYFTRNNVWKTDGIRNVLEQFAADSGAKFREELEDDLRNHFQFYAGSLEKGLGMLSGCGNLAPVIGFLGTVTGMISAFAAIAAATTVNAKVVAVGIQVALVTTAGGLIVAAPILFAYYAFIHVIQNRYIASEGIISELSSKLPRMSDSINS